MLFESAFKSIVDQTSDGREIMDIKWQAIYRSFKDPVQFKKLFEGENGEPLRDAHLVEELYSKWVMGSDKYSKQFERKKN